MAMTPCVLPAVGKPGFILGDDEIEIGMGIHGEPGVERTKIKTAKQVAEILLDKILSDYDYENGEVAVLVNGLGGTPLMELYILNREVQILLKEKGIKQSMSRKGNCLDNSCAENFFGILKSELFYPKEKEYKNIEELEKDIKEYIEYYNNSRIKSKLKGMSPIQYRKHSLIVA